MAFLGRLAAAIFIPFAQWAAKKSIAFIMLIAKIKKIGKKVEKAIDENDSGSIDDVINGM